MDSSTPSQLPLQLPTSLSFSERRRRAVAQQRATHIAARAAREAEEREALRVVLAEKQKIRDEILAARRLIRREAARIRDLVLERDGHACRVCNFTEVIEVHHIVSVAHGGTSEMDNLISLCANHHKMAQKRLIPKDHLQRLIQQPAYEDLTDILPGLATSRLWRSD